VTGSSVAEGEFVLALSCDGDADPMRMGAKAANLVALRRAGLPTPGGLCLSAAAYRVQTAALGLDESIERYAVVDPIEQRRLSVEIRLKLYEQPIAPYILTPLLKAFGSQRAAGSGKASC